MVAKQKSLILMTMLLMLFAVFTVNVVHAEDKLGLKAESAILIDGETGKILYQKQADVMLHPASMSKMMTEYLILEAVNDGTISWDQEVAISEYAYQISQNRSLSNVPLRIDYKYEVKELYEAMAIYSANGATIALAELVGGSEANFVKMMGDKAKELGLENYDFVNSTGLNNSSLAGNHHTGTETGENMLSARDTGKLAFHLINDYPEVLDTASIPKKTFREGTDDAINMSNWNWMLPELIYGYEGMDGLKTGSTTLAGYSFTATAERDGMRLISVVMKTGSYKERFEQTRHLLDYGFNTFQEKELYPAEYQIKDQSTLPVVKGKENVVEVASEQPLVTVIEKGKEDLYGVEYDFDKSLFTEEGALTAAIEKGQKVGEMKLTYSGEGELEYITGEESGEVTDVVTQSSVEKSNWFVLFFSAIGGYFADLFTAAADGIKGLF